eukprot:m.141739 g.141739  ORF g.141739 m.141739 type:complete len:167 (+) comp15984_c1_seq6:114-614(+)
MDVASLLAQQEGVIMRSTPSALRKSNTRDLTTLQQQLRALADRTLDVQRAAAVKYEKFMENTFRRMPDVYRELQQEGRVKMARPGVPATLQQKGRVASDKTQSGSRKGKVAASKSSKGKVKTCPFLSIAFLFKLEIGFFVDVQSALFRRLLSYRILMILAFRFIWL